MGFPSRRFQQAGAAPEELALLEDEFAALSRSEQAAEESTLASVDETALTSRLEGLRARLSPSDALDRVEAGEIEQKGADEQGEAGKPKRAGKAAQGDE
jgi:hypothetical protein